MRGNRQRRVLARTARFLLAFAVPCITACSGVERTRLARPPAELFEANQAGAPVVVAFVDFACPHCQRQAQQFSRLRQAMPEVAFRFYFVPATETSLKLAEVAFCARNLGLDEAVTLKLFEMPQATQREAIDLAVEFGSSMHQISQCVREPATINHLLESVSLSQRLQVTGLPTLFVGRERFDGVASAELLSESIMEQLSRPSADTKR